MSTKQILSILFCMCFYEMPAQPNLVPTFTSDPASNIKLGDHLTFSFKIKNIGTSTTQTSHTAIYLSSTPSLNNAFLLSSISTEALSANNETQNINFVIPLHYNLNFGNYYLIIYPDILHEVPGYINNSFTYSKTINIDSVGRQQNLPYPIILVHGLKSNQTTWYPLINDLKNFYGWSYGGNMNFCLNQDGNIYTSDISNDYKDWTDISNLNIADLYTVNFNVGRNGLDLSSNDAVVESNQSAIVKQGLAIHDAIKHVLQITGRDKVILLCHSMGGLAAREYIQNPGIWQTDGAHHVAKLVTLGTPHGGSNATSFGTGLGGIDEQSEAVRDLRYRYDLTLDQGVYLFGGSESYSVMKNGIFDYNNVDVNCNGIDADRTNIIGLNQKPLYIDLPYSCIIGDGDVLGGDGVVAVNRANLNNYYNNVADTFMCIKNIPIPFDSVWHSYLPRQTYFIMKGIDEPSDYTNGYNVNPDNFYFGNLTVQSGITGANVTDNDEYKFTVPSRQMLNLKVFNIPIGNCKIEILDYSLKSIYSMYSKGRGYLDINIPIDAGNYYFEVSGIADYYSSYFPYATKLSFTGNSVCPSSNVVFNSIIKGTLYQWQADNGTGYVNINNDSVYSGVDTYQLQLNSPPTNWYGYKYRCLVDGITVSEENILKFSVRWTGGINTAWENPINWNCGILPDSNTDVTINPGVLNFPQVNSNQSCRSLTLSSTAQVQVKSGFNLNITGK